MPNELPNRPSLAQLRRQAKELLAQLRSGDPDAWTRLRRTHPEFSRPKDGTSQQPALHQVQFVIARELGFPSWPKLKRAIEEDQTNQGEPSNVETLASIVQEITTALPAPAGIQAIIESFAQALQDAHHETRRWAVVVLSNHSPTLAGKRPNDIFGATLTPDHAQDTAARYFGFQSWKALEDNDNDAIDSRFESAVSAVTEGDTTALRSLLSSTPALVHQRSHWGHRATLLHYVAANGVEIHRQRVPSNAVETARILLEAGAEVDALAETYGGGPDQTLLSLLITSGHPHEANVVNPLLTLLAEFGCCLDGIDQSGRPLKTVLDFGYTKTAQHLAKLGAKSLSLGTAAGTGDIAAMQQFLNRDTDAKKKGAALYLAARNGQAEAVALLLEHKANPNARGWFQGTALQWAAINGHEPIVRKLVAAGADPNLRDERFKAHAAGWANEGGNEKIRDWLLDNGCTTSLTEAVAFNRIDLVEKLLTADPASVNERPGRTPLHEAAGRGHLEILNRLLASGADPQALDEAGFKPIDWAQRFQHEKVIQRLSTLEP